MGVGAAACMTCGHAPYSGSNFCRNCANPTSPGQAVCTGCGTAVGRSSSNGAFKGSKQRTTAGVLAILLGWTGVHKFYLGRPLPGVILAVAFWIGLCCGVFILLPLALCLATVVIGVIEGGIILGKTDGEFEREYVQGKKEWF
jgi:TM2 domain-containing membrane protein YozV